MINTIDNTRYINASHLAILARLTLFPEKPIKINLLRYVSEVASDNEACMRDLTNALPFITVEFTNPKTQDVEISINKEEFNEAKTWLDTYIENYKHGKLRGLTNTYKFTYNLKIFLKYLAESNYELSSFRLDSYKTDLNLAENKILETILYLNKRNYLSIADFKIVSCDDIHLQKHEIYGKAATGDGTIEPFLLEDYLRWVCTLEFHDLPEDIWRQETIKRDTLLTEQEWAILENIMLKEKEIADKLCISHQTVNTHKKNLFRKLRVNNKREAYLFYERKSIKF